MTKRLFVGNLSWGAQEDDVRKAFEAYGTVNSVNIVTDRESGKSRGFGFVDMENADAAINGLNGADFQGRKIAVNEARERQSSGGGDRRRY